MQEEEPSVAVVVTVKDDPRVVTCIEHVLDQDPPFAYEVTVVDNGSTDDTPQRLQDAFGQHDWVHLTRIEGNLSAAWNGAAQENGADVLVRIDADAVPEEGWLEALAAPILAGEADWTAGPVEGIRHESLVERYFHHRTETYCQRLDQAGTLPAGVPSWNVAYSREALDRAGWYDPWQASSVDWDLHKRLVDTGAEGRFASRAFIRHHHPRGLRAFARKEAWYRTGHYQMMLKYGPGTVANTFVLPGAYGLVLLLILASPLYPPLGILAGGLLVVYLLRHAYSGLKEDDPLWWARPLFRPVEAFAGLHGLIRGLLRYGVRRRPVPKSEAPSPQGGQVDG